MKQLKQCSAELSLFEDMALKSVHTCTHRVIDNAGDAQLYCTTEIEDERERTQVTTTALFHDTTAKILIPYRGAVAVMMTHSDLQVARQRGRRRHEVTC
jgi:hypothetical protein